MFEIAHRSRCIFRVNNYFRRADRATVQHLTSQKPRNPEFGEGSICYASHVGSKKPRTRL